MIYFMIPVFIILFLIAIWDIRTETIPHTLTILLLIFGIINMIIYSNDFRLPLFMALGTFLFYAILFFVSSKIGGGDVKILSISLLFINDINNLLIYCVCFFIAMMIGVLVTLYKNNKSLRLGPYMSISLIASIVYTNFTQIISMIFLIVITMILILYSINLFLYYRKDIYEKYEIAKIIKK